MKNRSTSWHTKTKPTLIKKFGSEEAWKAHLSEIGKMGGKSGTGHTFAHGRIAPDAAGKRGGRPRKGDEKTLH